MFQVPCNLLSRRISDSSVIARLLSVACIHGHKEIRTCYSTITSTVKSMELVKMVSSFACFHFHLEIKPICGKRRYPRDQSRPGMTAKRPSWQNSSPTPGLQDSGTRYPDSLRSKMKASVKLESALRVIKPNALITDLRKLLFSAHFTEASCLRYVCSLTPPPTGIS